MEEFKLKRHLKFTEKNYHNIVFFTGSGYMPITGANPYHTYINSNETLSFRVFNNIEFPFIIFDGTRQCYIWNSHLYGIDEEFKLNRNLRFPKPYIVGMRTPYD